jgi:hypothetical protein
VCGREIAVGKPLLKNCLGGSAVQFSTLGLFVFFVPTQAEPFQALKNRVDRSVGVALDVGVVEPQDHRAAIPAGIQPVENKGASAAHMKKSGGRGRKTNSRFMGRPAGQR